MNFQMINIGFGSTKLADEIVVVVSPASAPIKRMIQDAQLKGCLQDVTEGRQVRAVILVDTSSIQQFRHHALPASCPTDRAVLAPSHRHFDPSLIKIILSAIQPETVANRVVFKKNLLSHYSSSESPDSMDIKLINIGFGNIVSANRIIAIVSPESAPIKRIITDARDRGQLVDATYGRRTRAVIITDFGHIILSAIQPETVANRFVISKDGQGGGD
jgi:extracellular matrix regulatory protein A